MPILGSLGCCARAANDHATADPEIPLMKSRRRIAFPRPGTTPTMQLQQGFAASEMGFKDQFARQQSLAAHVRFGSLADIGTTTDPRGVVLPRASGTHA
jgi:hypothetical protein